MLSRDLQRHTDLHRTLGFKFRTQHALLRLFVAYAESFRDEFVDSGRVIDWAAQAPSAAQRRNRLLTVRRFALALRAEDARHEAPSADVFGCSGEPAEHGDLSPGRPDGEAGSSRHHGTARPAAG